MLTMNDIRKGAMVVLDGQPYLVVTADFMKKQQRRPVVRSILKHLKTNQTKEHTFMQSEKIAEADVDRKSYQFIYASPNEYQFMDPVTYEQLSLSAAEIGDMKDYLLEGQDVEILLFEGHPAQVSLPIKIDRKVISAPPGIKGNSSANVMKEVVVEGGAKIKAPLFIKEGDVIRIDTRAGSYVEKA